ncbi:hypothetical protein CEW83_17310 [Parazoarcus communis]|uniref:Uncharacterized protein n=1 Tax=Parazoarcus communis TaxID=41977 RepID=A0A2U8GSS3_9RHOO|nr:hypothetical protein CEW83_17310 [Parazoarcus communis]
MPAELEVQLDDLAQDAHDRSRFQVWAIRNTEFNMDTRQFPPVLRGFGLDRVEIRGIGEIPIAKSGNKLLAILPKETPEVFFTPSTCPDGRNGLYGLIPLRLFFRVKIIFI